MSKRRGSTARKERLGALIEEALVDCYNEEEQHGAFLVTLEDHIACPVRALVVGEEVTLVGFDREGMGEIAAKCRRGDRTYRINVTALEWPGALPPGAEWLEAYRAWLSGT